MKRLLAIVLLFGLSAPAQFTVPARTGATAGTSAATGFSDSFTGTAGTLLATHDANWLSLSGSWAVTNAKLSGSGTVQCSAWTQCGGYYNASSADTSQIVFNAQASATQVTKYVNVRSSGSTLGYAVRFSAVSGGNYTQVVGYKNQVWQATVASGGAWALNADHTVKISCSGTSTVNCTVYVDGSSVGTFSDSSSPLGAGHPGFYVDGSGSATATDNAVDSWQDN